MGFQRVDSKEARTTSALRRRRSGFAAWAVGAVAIGLVVTGCGSAGSSVDPVAAAADATGSTAGSDFSMTISENLPSLGNVPFSATGSEDFRGKRAQFTFDLSRLAALSKGQLPAGATMRAVLVYPNMYMSGPLFARALPAGKQWLGINLNEAAQRAGINLGQLSQLGQSDPGQYLQQLKASGGDVTKVGTDTVRGVRTTHYKTTIDLKRLVDRAPASQRAAARQSVDRLTQLTGSSSYPVEVWIDTAHRVRRERFTESLNVSGQHATLVGTVDLFNFGPKPNIKAPPAGEVVDALKLTGK